MIERKEYLEQLIGWKEEQVIKVVTGIRRCGKSTLLMQYQAWLRENGALDAQIVSVNFEELEYEELLDYKKLYAYLKERLVAGKTTYIFLDEIQKVPDFEKVVDSLYVKPNVDIYITGSNAYLLSGDLATLLTGRYVEIRMLPLSFQEFLAITELDAERGLAEYLRNGALPYVAKMSRTPEKVETYLGPASAQRKRPKQAKDHGYCAAENNRQISCKRGRQSGFHPQHHGLSDLQRQKNFSEYCQ